MWRLGTSAADSFDRGMDDMNLLVVLKQVPDTDAQIRIKDGKLDTSGVKFVVNPYDEFAIEEALRIKEKRGEVKITLLTLGPKRAVEALKSGLALGADEAFHLVHETIDGSDPYLSAFVLAKAIQKLEADIILCGKQGIDYYCEQTGIILAELLNLPHVAVVTKLEISDDGKQVTAHREIDGGIEVVESPVPLVVTAQKGLNEPRYASLKGIMAVRTKKIEEWSLQSLGLTPDEISGQARVNYESVTTPPSKPPAKIIQGEARDAARELVKILIEEAKVI
ncbi:MAG: electron transfer flavoprotein subunit beta/FixA family protein [Candidatus Eisenbacteria bacterium]|nr:electron transfer flavoprotein subunit beta/FixA family protein [Candidatus Eisenbacteria bacterium]